MSTKHTSATPAGIPRSRSRHTRRIRKLCPHLRRGYWERWAAQAPAFTPELVARMRAMMVRCSYATPRDVTDHRQPAPQPKPVDPAPEV